MTSNAATRKLALGTVQFGLAYGVANAHGQVAPGAVARILDEAAGAGIDTLDTAFAYGTSEQVLGQFAAGRFDIVTKLPAAGSMSESDVPSWVADHLNTSLQRLGVRQVHGLLLHRAEDLLDPVFGGALYRALRQAQEAGQVRKIGASIYAPQTLDALSHLPLDLVQAPMSIFDRRLEQSGWLARLAERGTELHARSAFLQGLLLMAPAERPRHFDAWGEAWRDWDRWLQDHGLSPLQACLGHVLGLPGVSRCVVGVDGVDQLRQILAAAAVDLPPLPPSSSALDPHWLNPSNWPRVPS